jgi:3-deoxy-7-phosphoheptulonate synthase
VADEPGALFKALQVLAARGLNMKKLESRPIHGKPWQYLFYVDVDMPAEAALFEQGIGELKDVTADLRVLGTYRSS